MSGQRLREGGRQRGAPEPGPRSGPPPWPPPLNQAAQIFPYPCWPWLHTTYMGLFTTPPHRPGAGLAEAWVHGKGRAPRGACVRL